MFMRHGQCSIKTELLMQNSYNLPMRGIFWCPYLGEEIYSDIYKSNCSGPRFLQQVKMWTTCKFEAVKIIFNTINSLCQRNEALEIYHKGDESCAEETPGWSCYLPASLLSAHAHVESITRFHQQICLPTAGSRPIIVTNGGLLSSSVLYLVAEMWWPGRLVGAPDSLRALSNKSREAPWL